MGIQFSAGFAYTAAAVVSKPKVLRSPALSEWEVKGKEKTLKLVRLNRTGATRKVVAAVKDMGLRGIRRGWMWRLSDLVMER